MSWNEAYGRLRARLFRRSAMYRAVFRAPDGEIGHAAEFVMADLARYCSADHPTLRYSRVTNTVDPLAMAFAEGRRDVLMHIRRQCNLTPAEIERHAQQRTNDD